MRFSYFCFALGLVSLLVGCNTTPRDKATIYYDRAQFASQVIKDYPDIKGPILQHGRCTLLVATPGSTTGTYSFCTFALTQDQLYVQGWDAKDLKYIELLRVDLESPNKVAFDSYFRSNQVQLIEPRRQSALSVVIDEGGYNDTAATERVYETIKKRGLAVVKSEGMMMPPAGPAPMVIPVFIPR